MTSRPEGLAAYVAVTAAYWAFMLSDGALRMLVLLHFHILGFSPVQLAFLFLLYECAGIVTNLSAGWIAARFGLTRTLYPTFPKWRAFWRQDRLTAPVDQAFSAQSGVCGRANARS